jgi:hypothetical protein
MKSYLVSCVTVQGISLKPEEDSPQAVQQGQPSQLPSPGAETRLSRTRPQYAKGRIRTLSLNAPRERRMGKGASSAPGLGG